MIKLETPVSEQKIRSLQVGDTVLLSGIIVTARDAAHKLMVEERPDFIREFLNESMIYHCGPVVKKNQAFGNLFLRGRLHQQGKNLIRLTSLKITM